MTINEIYSYVLEEADTFFIEECKKAIQCLQDEERTLTLMNIIQNTIENSETPNELSVIDLGAGSGILGLAALFQGVKQVSFVDNRDYAAPLIQRIIENLGFRDTGEGYIKENQYVEIHKADATKPLTYQMTGKFSNIDLVIAELVGTGFVEEPVVQAVKSIRPYTHNETQYIPSEGKHFVTLVEGDGPITEPTLYDTVDLSKVRKDGVDQILEIQVIRKGFPPYEFTFDSVLGYPGGVETAKFDSLCPTIGTDLQMDEPMRTLYPLVVKPGDSLRIHIGYKYGSGTATVKLCHYQPI